MTGERNRNDVPQKPEGHDQQENGYQETSAPEGCGRDAHCDRQYTP